MARFRVALSAEEFEDARVEAERRTITIEECLAGRLHGKAAEKTKKRVGPAHITIKKNSAYAEYDELPDAEHQFDMTAGSLRNAVTSVGADAPVKVLVGGDEVPVQSARIVVDEGVFFIDLTMPPPEPVSATEADEEVKAATDAFAVAEGTEVGGES